MRHYAPARAAPPDVGDGFGFFSAPTPRPPAGAGVGAGAGAPGAGPAGDSATLRQRRPFAGSAPVATAAPFAPFAAPRTALGAGSLLPGLSFPEEPGGGFGGLSPDGAALEAAVAAATRAAAGEADA